ncbi:NAD-dependent epimerase/dehydratase family protein [Alteromonas ponticola]|uniref:NAD-dependent epimerase/dehydratase family protein n=1 Tax=Alteromonas aquimaris TaxID=2998417 RepID=A0ABT3PA34_9ALTE|nr:NAD(P)H-binding protein [Alteromonas aquimaris]MCW8109641.1 NAD-dependent epimerase/dehydratase family protein [Alteromonas aquimaris]
MQRNITLCGCGWLGNYLLPVLADDFQVLGTTRSPHRAEQIKKNGGAVYLFELGDNPSELCQQSENATVILNIPPGRHHQEFNTYSQQMCSLIDAFMAHHARHLIFISTTSVYGEKERIVTENSELIPQTGSAKSHCTIEAYAKQRAGDAATIVRLAGLVGPDRHPVTSLSGKQLSQANRVVNLVHIHDVVIALKRVVEQGAASKTLHLCSLVHPTRKDYYTQCAMKMALPLPIFDEDQKEVKGKQIDASASWEYLGLTPKYASPFDMII